MRINRPTLAATAALFLPLVGSAQTDAPLLYREPALSATEICFMFAGDLWIVPRAGGSAHRLTASPGTESACHFSPDGKRVAYTNTIHGNADVYVISTAGGNPRRLTYHPGFDRVRGWTPDGKVLYVSTRHGIALTQAGGAPRLFAQDVNGVMPAAVDLPTVWDGAYSEDGKRLAYVPYPNANQVWKRYRGGRTTPIWIATLATASIERVPRDNSTDLWPMWIGDTVFFISDRDGPATLYGYDTKTRRVARRIENRGLDIKYASAGPSGIVYEQFGAIHLYDVATGKTAPVAIRPNGELTEALPHWVNVGNKLQHAALSPTGVRAAFEARGEIITVPAKKGDPRDVTRTAGATERHPAWSPDGQTLAYFSDHGGAYHLEVRGQTGAGDARTIKLGDADTYYYDPVWSPDGKNIAYSNSRGELWYVDVSSGKTTRVDVDPLGPLFDDAGFPVGWSPDSRWLAYARSIKNRLNAVFVYDLGRGVFTQVTDGLSDARTPAFDAGGEYLYFLASTDAGPASDFSMMTYDHPITRSLYAIVLRKDLPSPLAPESDEEKAKADSAAESTARAAAGDVRGAVAARPNKDSVAKVTPPAPVRIDFDGIDQRTIALPVAAKNYTVLLAGKSGTVVLAESPLVPVGQQNEDSLPPVIIHKFDLGQRKSTELISDVTAFDLSRDGDKLLYQWQGKWAIAPTEKPITPGDSAINTEDIQVLSDPRVEWAAMYREAFRLQRAFFYDPSYHGLDLAATERYYERYLPGIASRADLDYLLAEAFGNLTVGHLFIRPPDEGPNRAPPNGLLGADYTIEQGRWRFAKVYTGENWNPHFTAPLTQPGVNVQAGEYLLAVNGHPLTGSDNIEQALEGTAGKAVLLRVGPRPDGTGARDVTVVPLPSEAMLRHLAWADQNRRTVDKLSGGKLAYIYVPNTANAGYTRFNRYFFAQQDKLGAVVDERFNTGGNIADYMIEYLRRDSPFNYVTVRHGADIPVPAGAIYGPKVMLINEYAGSGGDELPWLFRRFKVGPLVGKRTWGGLVGIGGYPTLMDGGAVTAPRIALWTPEGDYAVENKGVAPDIEVDLEPAAWRKGHDTQLEKAVAMLLEQLAKRPSPAVKRPPFPIWAREGSTSH
ncbi:MAG TPA: PDZ domain-containing protein [Gemmatimonadales bacterium]|nr:PDZ domain-containing protein [Gemmatimonadales bacterium]